MPHAGTLFVVATPIGNLEDLTFRALRTLREVDLIAAEDTRRTAKLLAHYEIRKPLVSLREHNEVRETPRLSLGCRPASPSRWCPTPARPESPIPARGSFAAAGAPASGRANSWPERHRRRLSASGFRPTQFVFLGFPPAPALRERRWFDALAAERRTVVFFEAPHRIRADTGRLSDIFGRIDR